MICFLLEAYSRSNSLAAIRGRVLSFCTAQPRDGGTGALYVLLKRKR